jgi:hypothetical protein
MTLRKQRWILAACYSYDVTCNTKAGRRSCCICASVARTVSEMQRCFYAGLLSAYPRPPRGIANHGGEENPRIATILSSQRGVWKRSPGQSGRQIKGTSTPDKRTAASFISASRCHVLRLSKGPPIFLLESWLSSTVCGTGHPESQKSDQLSVIPSRAI